MVARQPKLTLYKDEAFEAALVEVKEVLELGVIGRAFASHNLVFCKDITQFNITEYPLAYYTRECSFTGCFAICLQESNTGDNVIVLELFLPPSYTEGGGIRGSSCFH
ncbi:hypothetical protein CsSME_00049549 [Camellia sinensis var. sinensis]